jgi:hypothetical protein
MSTFTEDLYFYLLFVGGLQLVLAAIIAVTLLPLAGLLLRIRFAILVRRFALFNGFLLAWGCLANSLWLVLTDAKLAVLDDCPVWAPFVPFGRRVLDGAGWWKLLNGTHLLELQFIWALITILVWILSFRSTCACRVLFARLTQYFRRTSTPEIPEERPETVAEY